MWERICYDGNMHWLKDDKKAKEDRCHTGKSCDCLSCFLFQIKKDR